MRRVSLWTLKTHISNNRLMASNPHGEISGKAEKRARPRVMREPDARLKPPLKWAGGKRWLAPIIHPYWQAHRDRRFVEPFCGGLAVTLALRPRHALLNDANPHLINFYEWLKKPFPVTIEARNDEGVYYANRERFNKLVRNGKRRSREAAQLFYYLNRTCFNGLCRFNQSGEFNVPFGTHAASLKYAGDFDHYRAVFSSWEFTNLDFAQLDIAPDDFIYADPPYDVDFTTYSQGGFSWADQVRAAEWLAAHPGPVILSNQATPRIKKLYRNLGFKLGYYDAPRRISCNGDRRAAREVLAVKGL
jgi:DNA adenine methylase